MIRIKGFYFNGRSSKSYPAILEYDGTEIRIQSDEGPILLNGSDLAVSMDIIPELGNTGRAILFSDGSRFETPDPEGVTLLEKTLGLNKFARIVGFFENQWKMVLACFVGLAGVTLGFISFGIPFIAKDIAFRLPQTVIQKISREAENILDQRFFEPSRLDDKIKNDIRQVFDSMVKDMNSNQAFSLVFKKSRFPVANAFALPSGMIIVTDMLIESLEDIREIEGIFIHETAHVIHRHGIRSVIQNTGVVLLVSLLVGDLASITSFSATIPTLLLESGYSRKFETEADEAVGNYFLSKNQSLKFYEDILIRITKDHPGLKGTEFISTHPETQRRIDHLRKLVL